MPFRYEAIDPAGQTLVDTVNANSMRDATDLLRERGLFVTRLEPTDDGGQDYTAQPADKAKVSAKLRDVVLFTQQMSMLIRSGARMVESLEAVEAQAQRPAWRSVVRAVRLDVEEGRPLSDALARFPRVFTGAYISMIAAGETSGEMGLAFERLAVLTRQQQDIRNRVIGALTYPAVLTLLCLAVVVVLFSFVLPRFAEMFEVLNVELPAATAMLVWASDWFVDHWPYLLGAAAGSVLGGFLFLRSPTGSAFISRFSIRVPLFGGIVRSIILARICRIWGQLIDSKVGVLEAVHLTRQSTRNLDFQQLLATVAQDITDGNSIGPALRESWLLPKTFAAAIVTGEASGRLADSLLFVASCLENDNAQVLASLTRVIEPIMLVFMGAVVGTAAVSLFLPLFDMATIAGG